MLLALHELGAAVVASSVRHNIGGRFAGGLHPEWVGQQRYHVLLEVQLLAVSELEDVLDDAVATVEDGED